MNQQVNDGQIVFDAARLYAGIAYHLRQTHAKLKYADYTRDSMVGLGLRLARQKATATCSRWDWARKTDWQRLCWLMRITGTTVKPLGKTGTAEVVPE